MAKNAIEVRYTSKDRNNSNAEYKFGIIIDWKPTQCT